MIESVAQFNLLEPIGEGGLGPVYRARDTRVGRTVALKLVPPAMLEDPSVREAFLQDARTAATLSHPNIATLFEVGEHDGRVFLAYEFASGVTLRQDTGGRAVNPRRALEIGVQLADALAEAHARGIVHGDLRPDTIVVTSKGSLRVLEFGMSKWTRGGKARRAAAKNPDSLDQDPMNVAGYLSPEQALGEPVDPRSDLFSLGTILYELLAGRNPFAGPTASSTLLNVIQAVPPRLAASRPDLPADLDVLLSRLLAKQVDRRHQSAAALAAELRSVLAILEVRSGESAPGELLPLHDRRSSPWGWLAAIVVVVILLAWYILAR